MEQTGSSGLAAACGEPDAVKVACPVREGGPGKRVSSNADTAPGADPHWLFGGRTDLANLVLLCDTDHGLVHDHDLVLSRNAGRLVVTTPDGRHIWGAADAAFTNGLPTLVPHRVTAGGAFVGVHPIDTAVGRRPADAPRPDPPPAPRTDPGSSATTDATRILQRRAPRPGHSGEPRTSESRPRESRPAKRRPRTQAGPSGRAAQPPHRGPGRRPVVVTAARTARHGARHASADCSSPTANPARRTACRSATTAWTCAGRSTCSWAPETSPAASPPRPAFRRQGLTGRLPAADRDRPRFRGSVRVASGTVCRSAAPGRC